MMVKLQTVCVAVAATASALLVARFNAWGPFNRQDGIIMGGEHGRNLIFEYTGPAFCWVGFNAGLVDLPISLPIPLSFLNSCICKDYQITKALATASTSFAFATTIQLCGGTVSVEKPFDLTGKNVVFTCQTPFFFACGFNGNKRSRIIEGSPISAIFRQMLFENGNAENERENVGGAMYLTGGTVVMENVGFKNNCAGAGGAIYLDQDATVTISRGSFFENQATKDASSAFVSAIDGMTPAGGGAIYNQGGLVVVDNGGGFFDNTAEGNGGAILTSIGTVRLGNVTFSGNDANFGDAIASLISIVTLSGTRFEATESRPPRYLKEAAGPGDKPAKEDMDEEEPDETDERAFSRNSKDSKDYSSKDSGSADTAKPSPAPVLPRVPTMAPSKASIGMGNLIYIADDMAASMSFVDCDTDPRVAFCDGIDVFEVGRKFLNTNCRENGRDELSDECEVH